MLIRGRTGTWETVIGIEAYALRLAQMQPEREFDLMSACKIRWRSRRTKSKVESVSERRWQS
jgi:hypothetical protein